MERKTLVKWCLLLIGALLFSAQVSFGAGNPILLVGTSSDQFSYYYSEILRAEGLNAFDVTDISAVTASSLGSYDVVILGQVPLTSAQVTTFTNWVNGGGNLIAMRPDKQLATLLGIGDLGTALSNGYLLVNTSVAPGAGIVGQTIQFHGAADQYVLNGASTVASLYSTVSVATPYPAVTLRTGIGAGGSAAAFTYDLARSVVYTRQGDPAWAGQARIGQGGPIRGADMYYGAAAFDPEPDWVDLNNIAIPQADEQQRLLANIILYLNQNKKPLPRFWYLPFGKKAAVIMTGDDHANGGTAGRFDDFIASSPAGCSVLNWECIRGTSYVYPGSPLTNAQAVSYDAQGFEVALHVTTNCADFTPATLESFFASQLSAFADSYPGLSAPTTNRTHCIAWSDWASEFQVELNHGIRLDTNYYYWPPSWVVSTPGFFTGSGMPMRFAQTDGTLVDVYQATTQMPDESDETFPDFINGLLDNAVGPAGFYGVFTANMHTDYNGPPNCSGVFCNSQQWADQIVSSAKSHGVPVVSSKQMLQWLDGRNGSSFGSISWNGNSLTFTVAAAAGADGLQAMLPAVMATGRLSTLTQSGTAVSYSLQTIKGIQYAVFPATSGAYQATYSTTWPPVITAVAANPVMTTATITWTTDESANSRVDYGTTGSLGTPVSDPSLMTAHNVSLSGLTPGTTYYFRVTSAVDSNNIASSPVAPATASFTTIDANPPVITAVAATPGTGGTATITWSTNKLSNSRVDYGPTTSLGTTVSNASLVAAHSITLAGLTTGMTYYYRVTSSDAAGNTASAPPASATFVENAPLNVWNSSATPANIDSADGSAVELGLKFRSDVAGIVAGVRFYKASTNSGTHIGNLWSSTGTLLGTVTFGNETTSGWQQANFTSPISIAANTTYVVSYFAPRGHYSDTTSGFASAGVDNPPLHALAEGVDGSNGVYRYSPTSGFPTSSYSSTNYWVDLAFFAADAVPPTVTNFTIPASSASLTVSIASFLATDNVGVTGYLVTESPTSPSAGALGWSATAPASYSFATAGAKTLYAWAKDAAGNVSASKSASVVITLTDTTPPTLTAFTIPATVTTLTVPIITFTATDNIGVTGYLVTESFAVPSPGDPGWSATAPASYTFTTAGGKTLYAWAKDAAGNVSTSLSASVVITIPAPEPTGWFAGDMHVHRSCGGSPEALSSMYDRMNPQNLAVISLLADMGNGEVQNPITDLPLVNGQDASISTPGRIVHWDTEWHWDTTYTQYPHQALGGHIVALGLTAAQQIWYEYTYPVFNWAHQHNAIAGFAHLERMDNNLPSYVDCCTPIEYPVEVALGSSDFISEDVTDINSTQGMCPECAIQAYYRLLNTGFRPGYAAGTDYPCNSGEDLGTLLTYVQVAGGQLTYNNWIQGIAKGRTVVSRNGHNEFLNLVVNNSATPGDEIKLTGPGSVAVAVTWTATQNLTGTIELVQNGVVVASQQASAGPGAPASLSTQVNFTSSGWLAARRMGTNGHYVQTAAVFVTVNSAPVRASASDAQFYVAWMNTLLTNTSPGGIWNSYFPTSLSQAQTRYQSAKTIYQQIAADATPPVITAVMSNPVSTTATITWTTDKNANSRVDYGTTTSLGTTASDPALVTAHSINLSALAAGTTYYFRVTSVDGFNNSASSPVAPATANFTTIDTTPPLITAVSAAPGAGGTATITWTTNKLSNSQVDYGTTTSLGSTAINASMVSSHSIILTGLTTGTTYYYRVTSADALGDTSSSPVAPATANFVENASVSVWSSSATPATVDSADGSAVELGMKVRSDVVGVVTGVRFYKASTNTGTHVGNLWSSTGTLLGTVTFANETASGWQQANFASPISIAANTTYVVSYFAPNGHYSNTTSGFASAGVDNPPLHALANGVDGSNGVYRYGSSSGFPTSSWNSTNYWVDLVFLDNVPPVISGVAAATTSTTATITWTTGEASNSRVDYGTSSNSLMQSATNATLVTAHSITLTGLTTGTTYYYRVTSVDGSGNSSTSPVLSNSPLSFVATDTTPPVITALTSNPGSTTATITWTTDKNANSRVDYGTTTSLGTTASDPALVTAHSINLSALAVGTTYYFRVTSVDGFNNSASSPVAPATANFTTIDTTPPLITAVSAAPGAGGTATVTWTTNKLSNSQVDYGTTTSLGSTATNASMVSSHSITLTGLNAGTTYYYRVTSADALGDTSSSPVAPATANFVENASVSVWSSSATPATVDSADGSAVELGMKFRSDVVGVVSGVRFYKASTNTGTHIGNLWSSTGTLLGTVTFANETASGWQQANFASPISIAANTTYVVSYFAPNGHYSNTTSGFASAGVDNPPLHAIGNGVDGSNGVYRYGSSSGFPTSSWNSTNYWVDLVFLDNVPPVISGVAAATTSTTATITWTTGEASNSRVDYGTSSDSLTQSATNATLVTAHSITLTGLTTGTTYYYRVTSVDASGNGASSPVTPATANFTTVVDSAATSTTATSSPNPSTFGQSVTFTSTTTSSGGVPVGTVTFTEGATVLASNVTANGGQASFSITGLTVGSHTITATFTGASGWANSSGNAAPQVVNNAGTSTTANSSPNPSTFGQAVTFTSTTTSGGGVPVGTVTFTEGATVLASNVTVNGSGQASFSTTALSVGSHTITATFTGASGWANSSGNAAPQVVNTTATTTTATSSPNPSTFGQSVTFTSTTTSSGGGVPVGTVTFTEGATVLASNVTVSGSGQASFSTPTLSVGSHTITATFTGATGWANSSGDAGPQVVNNATATSTTATSSPNPSTFGQSVTFTSTTTSSGSVPVGTVTFTEGATVLASNVTVNGSGQASFSTTGLTVGSHTITATFTGASGWANSSGTAPSQVVNSAATSTTASSSPNPSTFGQSVTFTSTTSSSGGVPVGTVTFTEGATVLASNVTVSGSGLASFSTTGLTVGSHTITATFTGASGWAYSSGTAPSQVVNSAATSTTVSSSPNPSVFGQSVTLTSTTTSSGGVPVGTVTFTEGATVLASNVTVSGSGQASFSTTMLAVGSHTITATFTGASGWANSSGNAPSQVVNNAATTTAVSSSANPSVYSQPVTFTATVTATAPGSGVPTGTVTFRNGSSTLGTGALDGTGHATFTISTLAVGSASITAVYGGSSSFNTSTSSNLTQTVNRDNTATVVSSSANPSVYSQPVTFTATVTANLPGSGVPTGTVTFRNGGSTLGTGTLNGSGIATYTTSSLAVGSRSITAVYGGSTSFNTSTSPVLTQTVNKDNTATVVSSSANPSVYSRPVTFTATVTAAAPGGGVPTGTVTFRNGGSTLGTGTLNGSGIATFTTSTLAVGSASITAVYGGSTSFNTSTSPVLTQTVNQDGTTSAVTSSPNPSTTNQSVTFTATVAAIAPGTATPTGTVTFKDGTTTLGTGTLSSGRATYSTSTLSTGTHQISAVYGGSSSFLSSTSPLLVQTVN